MSAQLAPELIWLHENWTVRATSGPVPPEVGTRAIPAEVPGCVSTDLMAARFLPDPYIGTNERLHRWVGRCNWRYETAFHASAPQDSERVDIVCMGLDTVATVRLNGEVIGSAANMHRSYRFDARRALRPGQNHLSVDFEAPVDAAERWSRELGPRPHAGQHPYNSVRKMACNYGWDWGPELPTVGIWRPIGLHRWRGARIASVRALASVHLERERKPDHCGAAYVQREPPPADETSPRMAKGSLEVHIELEWAASTAPLGKLVLSASVAGTTTTREVLPGEAHAAVLVQVGEVELWWPAGYGAQPLYEVEVTLAAPTGARLDRWAGRTGFCSVELDTGRDERGARLGFVVNGRAVQVRGANWIPDDCFVTRVGPGRYRQRLTQARGANVNLIRVWGGGIYENEAFYDTADELGLLVWQDFMLACAAYSEEEPLRGEIEREAREAVTRLSRHPSVACYSGGNENLWGYEDWGWEQALKGRSWGAAYYFETFPALLRELDPARPYMAGSPWSLGYRAHPNDPSYGSMHVWDVWNEKDYPSYREHQPQFVAEFGFQGPPAWRTLAAAVTKDLSATSEELAAHQKAVDGMRKLGRWLEAHFRELGPFEDWHWATSLNQARAVTLAVEYWRSLMPRCRGTILWQLNDCWPVISWAVVDGEGRLKPAWYALRRAFADRLLTVQPAPTPEGGPLAAVAVNDSLATWELDLHVTRQDFAGRVLAEDSFALRARPGERASVPLGVALSKPAAPERELLVVEGSGHRALWFYREDKDLDLPSPAIEVGLERSTGGYEASFRAESLQRDVALLVDRLDPEATCDDMLFTLLPGEQATAHISTNALLDPEMVGAPTVLRSANQLCKR